MWNSFLLCALIFLIALYGPGYLFFRALRVSRLFAIGCAPLYSVAVYALLPIIFQKVGITCNWAALFFPALIVALALLLALNRKGEQVYGAVTIDKSWLIFGLYLAAGLAACWFIVVSGLGDFDTFYNRHDNSTHLNAIRAFIDSGNWSSLGMNAYLTAPEEAWPYDMGSAFYPSAWHDVVALAVSLTHCPEAVAINAFNAVICGVIYPSSMFLLMLFLNKGDRLSLAVGAVVTPAFNTFPWYFFLKGPIVGNMLAFAMVPAVCALFAVLCKHAVRKATFIGLFAVVALIACIALGLAQPNGLFTFYVFAAAFLGRQMRLFLKDRYEQRRFTRWQVVVAALGFVLAVVVVWFAAYKIPVFFDVVNYRYARDNGLDPGNTLYDVLSLGLVISYPQWLLAALALIGFLALTARRRLWIAFPPAFFAVAYFCARAFYEKRPRQYLAGFWYSDPTRIAASLTIFLTPLVSMGLAAVIRGILRFLKAFADGRGPVEMDRRANAAITVILLAAFCCYAYFPNFTPDIWDTDEVTKTPMGIVKQRIANEYNADKEQVYSSEERAFVKKALELIPDNALVLNQPHDGSVFAYGLEGLNTYFRSAATFGYNDTAETIRQGLDNIATDKAVQDAVKSTGAEYLIMLDQGVAYKDGKWLSTYYDSYVPFWDGLNKVTDETPGFELLLSDGDMRLYKITATEDAQ